MLSSCTCSCQLHAHEAWLQHILVLASVEQRVQATLLAAACILRSRWVNDCIGSTRLAPFFSALLGAQLSPGSTSAVSGRVLRPHTSPQQAAAEYSAGLRHQGKPQAHAACCGLAWDSPSQASTVAVHGCVQNSGMQTMRDIRDSDTINEALKHAALLSACWKQRACCSFSSTAGCRSGGCRRRRGAGSSTGSMVLGASYRRGPGAAAGRQVGGAHGSFGAGWQGLFGPRSCAGRGSVLSTGMLWLMPAEHFWPLNLW